MIRYINSDYRVIIIYYKQRRKIENSKIAKFLFCLTEEYRNKVAVCS